MSTKFTFIVESLRKFIDPLKPGRARYFAVVSASHLPDNFPMETNPREQNLNSKVAKKIRDGFLGEESGPMFHLLNRGLLISAEAVQYDNQTDEMTIVMADPRTHGVVDGGHTYRIVTSEKQNITDSRFVTLEVMTGVEDVFEDVAGARNTSVQVKEKSLAELEGKLDVVKVLVKNLPFAGDIAYKENEEKAIDVQEVIAILTIFNNGLSSSHPVYAYSSKGRTLQTYLANIDSYSKLAKVVPGIFKLHDHVKNTLPEVVKSLGGRPGALKEIGYKNGKMRWPLLFSPKESGDFVKTAYDIPAGFVYPILSAMRFLVVANESTGEYEWRSDPVKFYDSTVGKKLVELTLDASSELGRNPMAVGKSSRHWEGLYNYVAATFLTPKKATS
ncbi:MAG: AIPR family protein [Acidobacteriota bacterium]|nr:AIPR family protein [Acidobacteriota bacterium]